MVQMTIFDFIKDEKPIDQKLLDQLLVRCSPYWVNSKEKIIKACNDELDISDLAKIVREQYCPYGFSGGLRHAEANELEEFLLKPGSIMLWYLDKLGKRQGIKYKWSDFARYIYFMVLKGEY